MSAYAISSFSIYKNKDAIAIAGKTSPTSGTRIEGRYAAAIRKLLHIGFKVPIKPKNAKP
jgi:hypothetical protein